MQFVRCLWNIPVVRGVTLAVQTLSEMHKGRVIHEELGLIVYLKELCVARRGMAELASTYIISV